MTDEEFARDQRRTARRLGYGSDVELMNAHHDPMHRALCDWLGVPSYAIAVARGERLTAEQYALAAFEEDAVLMVQKLMRAHGAGVPGAQIAAVLRPIAVDKENENGHATERAAEPGSTGPGSD